MGRYGYVEHEDEVTYRGITYTYEIYQDDSSHDNPLDFGDDGIGIWIHDNATRSWGGIAMGESIWAALDNAKVYPEDAEEAYSMWAEKRYDAAMERECPALFDDAMTPSGSEVDQARKIARREAWGIQSIAEFFERETGGIARVLYGFEHSVRHVSLADFGDRWDSGAIGIVYMTPRMIRDRMMWKRITKARRKKMLGYMRQDIESLDNWLNGHIYGYVFYDEHGNEPTWNSCWGHYDELGSPYTIGEAVDAIKADIDRRFLDMDVKRVERLVAATGFMLGKMTLADEENESLVNSRMMRMRYAVERLPDWRRGEALAAFDPAYDAAVTHPFLASPTLYITAWDSNVTTSYGGIG
jgi:hypothetical protein